jgi:cobalt/nickel transport system permease protein
MHMADALLSPTVGATLWAATAGTIAIGSHRVARSFDDRRIPLMGVLGAFVFAAQMINFTIPGTGSSGHLGGGLLLAILLGPHAAFLTLASVLIVQALFFADGGLLALGCNIFNLGFFPCYIAYPFIYRRIVTPGAGRGRLLTGTLLAAIVGLQLGAFSVVLETTLSGVAELTLPAFTLLMQPIHLAIGAIEGLATAAIVLFLATARPDILNGINPEAQSGLSLRRLGIALLLCTALTGGLISWFASDLPDGLEWALSQATGHEEVAAPATLPHQLSTALQEKTSLMPDYAPSGQSESGRLGTSLAGLIGSGLVLLLTAGAVRLLRPRRVRSDNSTPN